MSKKDMIAWFVKELELSHADVAKILNLYGDNNQIEYSAKQTRQMTLGRLEWPIGTWDALRIAATQQIANSQTATELFNQTNAVACRVPAKELSRPFGKLKLLMTCVLLRGNSVIFVD